MPPRYALRLLDNLGGDCPTSPAQVSTCTEYLRGVMVASHGRTGAGSSGPEDERRGRKMEQPRQTVTGTRQLSTRTASGRDSRLKARLCLPDRSHCNASPARCPGDQGIL